MQCRKRSRMADMSLVSSSVEINDSVKYNISNWKSHNCRMFEQNADESDTIGYLPLYDGSSQHAFTIG